MRRKKTNCGFTKLFAACVFVMLLLCLLLTGCGDTKEMMDKKRQEENRVIVGNFRTVEYNGHSYIVYREFHGPHHTFSGLTHDPDCGCEEIEYYGCEVFKLCSCEEDDAIQ